MLPLPPSLPARMDAHPIVLGLHGSKSVCGQGLGTPIERQAPHLPAPALGGRATRPHEKGQSCFSLPGLSSARSLCFPEFR